MPDPVNLLLQLGVILLSGLLLTALCRRLRIPELLVFIIYGFLLGRLTFQGARVFDFSLEFVTVISLLALALFVFEGSAGFHLAEINVMAVKALKLVGWALLIHLPLFTLAAVALGFPAGLAVIFAGIMLGTGELVVLPMLGTAKGGVIDLLKFESLLNTPVNIIIPFMVLDFLQARPGSGFFDVLLSQVNPFLLKIFVGIGVGIVAGFVLFKVLRSVYEAVHSPLAMLTAAVLSYGLAERLGGSGVLSVTAVGAIFGNVYLAEPVRGKLMEIESVFSRSLFILLFVLFGTILEVQYTWAFLVAGIGLLIVYLCARYLIVTLALGRKTAGRVRAFMTLMSPNGAPAIAVASFVGGLGLPGAREVVGLTGFVIALQILVASVAVRFKDRLLPAGNPGAAGIDLLRQKARQQGLKEA